MLTERKTCRFVHIAVLGAMAHLAGLACGAFADDAKEWSARHVSELVDLYRQLHAAPELSFQEEQTAARLAEELKQAGCEVTQKIGRHGVVGLLKNGGGPTVMVRTDLDALPVTEATALPFASKARGVDRQGNDVGVMHACGHDVHITCLVGTARYLAANKDKWRGTVMFIGQPAEEIGAGALEMLKDGLFAKFKKPDYALALHVDRNAPQTAIELCRRLREGDPPIYVGHAALHDGTLLVNASCLREEQLGPLAVALNAL